MSIVSDLFAVVKLTLVLVAVTISSMFIILLFGCVYSPDHQSEPFEPSDKMVLKYPVVLVHGIARHDRGRIITSWGKIPEVLQDNGVKVFFGNTDAWGGVESNAGILKASVDQILEETKSEKVNIIAHSKGGIDSRYFIWKYDYGDRVASLTTISTPHHGSEVADSLYGRERLHSKRIRRRLVVFGKLYGDVNPDVYNVNYQLTTESMKTFNETVTMDDRVYYQSMYTVMNDVSDDPVFSRSYQYIKSVSGDNDGLVSAYSASWGDNVIKIGGGISHEQIIDQNRKKTSTIDIPNIYLGIVKELSEKGL
jgi:triacylglycerol lipase